MDDIEALCQRMKRMTGLEPIGLTDMLKIIKNDELSRITLIRYLTEMTEEVGTSK